MLLCMMFLRGMRRRIWLGLYYRINKIFELSHLPEFYLFALFDKSFMRFW
jgi:hypothetical protein